MTTFWIALRALAYASAFVLLWGWIAYQAHLRDDHLAVTLPGSAGPVGMALMGLGGLLAPRRFVADGPYRWVRNPMYVGGFLVLLGYALYAASPAALGVPFAMLGLAHLFVVLYEEPTLERRFGESYLSYKRTTPRWIPRPPR